MMVTAALAGQASERRIVMWSQAVTLVAPTKPFRQTDSTLRRFFAFAIDLVLDTRPRRVDDVLGLIEKRCNTGVIAEAFGLSGSRRRHQGAVTPVDVGHTPLKAFTRLGASPRSFGSKVDVALPHRVTGGIGTTLEILAILTHRHTSILPSGPLFRPAASPKLEIRKALSYHDGV